MARAMHLSPATGSKTQNRGAAVSCGYLLYSALLSGDTAAYLAAYREHCLTLHQDVLLLQNDVTTPAYALDVDEALGLLVRYPDGGQALVRSGEASVRGLTGYAQ